MITKSTFIKILKESTVGLNELKTMLNKINIHWYFLEDLTNDEYTTDSFVICNDKLDDKGFVIIPKESIDALNIFGLTSLYVWLQYHTNLLSEFEVDYRTPHNRFVNLSVKNKSNEDINYVYEFDAEFNNKIYRRIEISNAKNLMDAWEKASLMYNNMMKIDDVKPISLNYQGMHYKK